MKEPDHFGETLPEGVQLTLSELRDMAYRQQTQIDSQHQMLAAKEQRLRYLKEQEARQQRVQAESERLRRLRDRVDAQELKLRKLRVLRGQVDHQKQNNISLTSDLDSIRALFNEKEKELSLAVAKVEELTRQLEELRRGRNDRDQPPASALELDKLRRELLYRNKLNEQQNQRLNQQREALTARQEEMSAIDKRISELQERLHKKRLLNQQLASQISAASHKAAYHQLVRLTSGGADQNFNRGNHQQPAVTRGPPRVNIAAVEPYNHIPLRKNQQQNPPVNKQEAQPYLVYQNKNNGSAKENEEPGNNVNNNNNNNEEPHQDFAKLMKYYGPKSDDNDILKEFNVSKLDPKYQTLPYNTKFTINLLPNKILNNNNKVVEGGGDSGGIAGHLHHNHHPDVTNNVQAAHMTVHSSPLLIVSKNVATPLTPSSSTSQIENANIFSYQKPVSSVAPTSVHHPANAANIYQTSSIKIQPVEPQTSANGKKDESLILSPPQSSSTPNTSELSLDKSKPALPPKPSAIKPPPRQTVSDQDQIPPPLPSSEPPHEEPPNKPVLAVQPTPDSDPIPDANPQDPLDGDEVDKSEDKTSVIVSAPSNNRGVKFRKGNLKQTGKSNLSRRVSFDPLALLLDASLEGELELVKKTTTQVANPSAANDEGITALHNAICAGHFEIVKYLVEFGCDVNAQDSDGWTPLHCAASCNNVSMVKFLVEHGACIFATTLSDHETAAEKCEEDEEGFDGCSEYLYSVQEKLGILANGIVYGVFDYAAQQLDELSFRAGDQLTVLRKGDENEREWWWSQLGDKQGYVPRNLLGLYPRVVSRTEE